MDERLIDESGCESKGEIDNGNIDEEDVSMPQVDFHPRRRRLHHHLRLSRTVLSDSGT